MLPEHDTPPVNDVDSRQPPVMLATDELDYHLPEQLIATEPAQPRDSARLLVVYRASAEIEHRHMRDLPEYVRPGDTMVFNATAVTPARLSGQRADTRGRVEGLFLGVVNDGLWEVMLKSNGRLRPGQRVQLFDTDGTLSHHELELVQRRDEKWLVRAGDHDAQAVLEQVGRTPLPPYILRARGKSEIADALDRLWYQTVYASGSPEHRLSVAAPTAGLHFTEPLLHQLDQRGVQRLNVLLHVGAGTFKPVTAPTLNEHVMHRERYEVPAETVAAVARAKRDGNRVIAVGTTTVRTLESLPNPLPARDQALCGETELLIAPPYTFRHVDALLTNFHLPRSTLLALVGAMVGLERLMAIYREAIEREYRFYSYGDAMLIV